MFSPVLRILIACGAFVVTACMPPLPSTGPRFSTVVPPPGYATVYLFIKKWRSYGRMDPKPWSTFRRPIMVDDKRVADLQEGTYSYVFLRPGDHMVKMMGAEHGFLLHYHRTPMHVEAGRAYAYAVTFGTEWALPLGEFNSDVTEAFTPLAAADQELLDCYFIPPTVSRLN